MINVLQTGASNLTLADTNEEAANLLALQTRQQLSSTALSLASQADQNILRLFRSRTASASLPARRAIWPAFVFWACAMAIARRAGALGVSGYSPPHEMRRGRDFGPGKAGRSGKVGVGLLRPAQRARFIAAYPTPVAKAGMVCSGTAARPCPNPLRDAP
jgi:hypothetical protein